MKKIITLFCVLVASFAIAQETTETVTTTVSTTNDGQRRNDIILNPVALLLGVVDLSYEHHLSKDSGMGVTTLFIWDDYVVDNSSYWHILPHYRYYFGQKWARGFFLEGFTGLVGRKYDKINGFYNGYFLYDT